MLQFKIFSVTVEYLNFNFYMKISVESCREFMNIPNYHIIRIWATFD